MSYKKLNQYVSYLGSFPRLSAKDFLKLERIRLFLKKLGHPEKTFRGIQVAGTNGKGSCVAFLEAMLKQAGYRVGAFYSPHLVSITERIRINEKNIPEKRFAKIVERLKPLVNEVEKEINDRITWFELITAVAVIYFFEENVDLVVFEVGLGGRLDATSALGLTTKVITNISYDHTGILGNTIAKLAYEKAGIINKGDLVVTATNGKALKLIQEQVKRQNGSLLVVGKEIKYSINKVNLRGTYLDIQRLRDLKISLIGQHQALNFACALGAIEVLKEKGVVISNEDIKKAVAKVKLEGRFQILDNNPLVILDGAHNLSGIKNLLRTLKDLKLNDKNLVFIFGAKKRKKQIPAILRLISSYSPKIIFPNITSQSEFYSSKILKKHYPSAQTTPDLEKAIEKAKESAGKKGTVVVCGSLYLIGEVLRLKYEGKKMTVDLMDDNIVERMKIKEKFKSK